MRSIVRRYLTVAALGLGGLGCTGAPAVGARDVRRTARFQDPRIDESSAVVRGRTNPDFLWTLNDSGNPPELFAFDTLGRTRAVVLVEGVANIDWEALAVAPCGGEPCLWIGDIGDNRGIRPTVTFYRVREPVLGTADSIAVRPVDSAVAVYPDQPHDAEALVPTADGGAMVVTKGRDGWIGVFRLPPDAWSQARVTLVPMGRLAIGTGFALGRLVTDAAPSPDGRYLAVRTYRAIFLFAAKADGTFASDRPIAACSIAGLEPQGEGIGYWDDRTLVLTSERGMSRSAAPITLLRCPAP